MGSSEKKYEYRIVPKVWKYRSKVRYYQDKEQFDRNKSGYRHVRLERREVGEWEEVDNG